MDELRRIWRRRLETRRSIGASTFCSRLCRISWITCGRPSDRKAPWRMMSALSLCAQHHS